MKLIRKNISGFTIVIFLIVIFTILFFLFAPSRPLAPYSELSSSAAPSSSTEQENYTEYAGNEPFFTVQVPADWVKVTQNGYPTWICREYNSSLQIQTFPSSSDILDITGESIRREIEAFGGELVDFYWLDEWNYTVSYRTYQKSGTTAHIEVTAFNTKDVIRFVFAITEIHYEQVYPVVSTVLDSFQWNRFTSSPPHGD